MKRTWEDNALEFGALSKQGVDVRLALLVACSVEPGVGDRSRSRNDRNAIKDKTSARAFGLKAGTTAPRVLRHLDAWNKIADRRLVKQAASLKPDDAATYEISEKAIKAFHEEFDSSGSGGRQYGNVATAVDVIDKRGAEAVVAGMTSDQRDKIETAIAQKRHEDLVASGAKQPGRREVPQPTAFDQEIADLQWMALPRLLDEIAENIEFMLPKLSVETRQRFAKLLEEAQHKFDVIKALLLTDPAELDADAALRRWTENQ